VNAQEMAEVIRRSDDSYREPLDAEVPWDFGGDKLYVRRLPFGTIKPYVRDGVLVFTGDVVPKLIVRAIVTEHGERVLSERDIKVLDDKDHDLVTAIFGAVARVNGFDDEAKEAAEKSFGEAQNEEPSTG
jgi:hypothetical protein